MSFQIYRNSSIGESLMETIEDLAAENKISEDLALAVLKQFDTSMSKGMKQFVTGKATMKASLKTYNYYLNVWTFSLNEVELKLNASGTGSMANSVTLTCPNAKVVLVDAELAKATAT